MKKNIGLVLIAGIVIFIGAIVYINISLKGSLKNSGSGALAMPIVRQQPEKKNATQINGHSDRDQDSDIEKEPPLKSEPLAY